MDWFWNLAIFIPIATESWPLICGGPEKCHTLYKHSPLQPLQTFSDFNWMLAVFFPNVQCLFVVFLRYKVCHTLCKHFPLQPLQPFYDFNWMLAVFFPNVQCSFVVFLWYEVCHTLCKHFPLQPPGVWCEFHWSHSPGQRTTRKQLTGRIEVCYKHIDRDSKLLNSLHTISLYIGLRVTEANCEADRFLERHWILFPAIFRSRSGLLIWKKRTKQLLKGFH